MAGLQSLDRIPYRPPDIGRISEQLVYGDGWVINALRQHWPEYLMEAAGLGMFMISACLFGTLLEYPGSPVHNAIADPMLRRVLMGFAMGLTAIGIIYSPWGKQSGAHINPSITMTFFRLGKIGAPRCHILHGSPVRRRRSRCPDLLPRLGQPPGGQPCQLCRHASGPGRKRRRVHRGGRHLVRPDGHAMRLIQPTDRN